VGVDLKLDSALEVGRNEGFSPCEIRGKASGFELTIERAAVVLGDYPSLVEAVGTRPHVVCFRWGGDLTECACVLSAALALVRSFGAVAYYPSDDLVYDAAALERDLRERLAAV
jgi:hypothetical protein